MKNRIVYLDQLRGIAIILVVIGHSIQNNTVESTQSPLFSWIYSFHMPLFMFICGYVAFKTTRINSLNGLLKYIKNKVITLLIPYFSWTILVHNFFFTKAGFNNNNIVTIIGASLKWNPFWFLFALFIITVLYALFFFVSFLVNKKSNLMLEAAVFGLIILALFLVKCLAIPIPVIDIESLILYSLFFYFGHFISKFSLLKNILLGKYLFFIASILFILLSAKYDYHDLGMRNKIIKIIVSSSAIVIFYYVVNKIQWNSFVDKYVQLCGQNTMVIYTTHFSLNYMLLGFPLLSHLSIFSLTLITCAFSILVIIVCILSKNLVELSPILNFLLYGKKIINTN